MLTEKYRHVELPFCIQTDITIEDINQTVEMLNNNFNSDDFYASINSEGLDLWLRALDLSALDLLSENVSKPQQDLLKLVSDKISGIGSYGVKGKKRLFVGYNKERKVADRKQKSARRGKHYYAVDHEYAKSNSDVPSEFIDQIICDDSEKILKKLPDNCIDLVFTSPPYNFGLNYKSDESQGDSTDWESYFEKLFSIFKECIRVLKYGGRIVVNLQPLYSDYIPSHHIISNYFMSQKLIWKGEILWEKNNYNCKYTAWGSWKSPSSPYLKYTWEFLEVFCKGNLKKSGKSENADIDAESFKEWVLAKWSIAPERNMKKFDHPAMFPEELARRVLLLFSFRGDIVLDPFNGVGTTSMVAKRHGRRYLGIDVSENYCDMSQTRLFNNQREIF